MTEENPQIPKNPAPVRRRRIILMPPTTPAGDGGPEKPKNRTRTLPGVTAPPSRETTARRKRKSTRSNETERPTNHNLDRKAPNVHRRWEIHGQRHQMSNLNSGSAQGENTEKSERKRRRRSTRGKGKSVEHRATGRPGKPVEAIIDDKPINLNEEQLERRRGRERKGRPVGRYQMLVHVHEGSNSHSSARRTFPDRTLRQSSIR